MMAVRPWLVAVGGGTLVLTAFALALRSDRKNRDGDAVDIDRARAGQVEEKAARADSAKAATQYRVDTLRLRSVETRYRTLRDTINVHDTIQVFRALVLADEATRVCRTALLTAEAQTSACEAKARALTAQRDAWARIASRPGPRVETSLSALYDFRDRAPVAQAEVELRLVGRLSGVAQASHVVAPHESPTIQAGLKWRF